MPSYPYALTIVNPSAELGSTTGWTNVIGTLRAVQSAAGNFPAHGLWFFSSGATASAEAQQDVALPSAVLADVDAGRLEAKFIGSMAGYLDNDYGWLSLACLDSSGAPLGGLTISPPTSSGQNLWLLRELVATVPPGTRTLRLAMCGQRTSGTNLDVYWDDLSLSLLFNPDAPGEGETPPPTNIPTIPDLLAWYAAEDLTGAAGSAIDQWPDRSPASRMLTQGTAIRKPTIEVLSGIRTAKFDTHYLATVAGSAPFSLGYSAFFRAARANTTFAHQAFGSLRSSAGWRNTFIAVANANGITNGVDYWDDASGHKTSSTVLPRDGTFVTVEYHVQSSGIVEIIVNGATVLLSTLTAFASGARQIFLGAPNATAGEYFKGNLQHALFFGRVLTESERQLVRATIGGGAPPPPLPTLTAPTVLTPTADESVTSRPVRITWTPSAEV